MKKCSKCGEEFPNTKEYFCLKNGGNSGRGNIDGLSNDCRGCRSIYNKKYQIEHQDNSIAYRKMYWKENKETLAISSKKWQEKNKESVVAKRKIYLKENHESVRKREREYVRTHKEIISAISRRTYLKNRESRLNEQHVYYKINKVSIGIRQKKYAQINKVHIAAMSKIYRKNNREARKIYERLNKESLDVKAKIYRKINKVAIAKVRKKYVKENPDIFRKHNQKRKATKRNLPHTLTVQQWEETKLYFDNSCAYCGEELPLEQEHYIALTKGGEYAKSNIICACKSCNSSKHNNPCHEWYLKQPFYSKAREQKILAYLGYSNGIQQLSLL